MLMSIRFAVVSLAVTVVICSQALAVTVDYRGLGTFQTPLLNVGGITVTGSADIQVDQFNGLGIVGGNNTLIDRDGVETIEFTFNSGGASDVTYFVSPAGNGDGDGFVGERELEAFAIGGASLGTLLLDGGGVSPVTALFGNQSIERFRLTALDNDWHIVNSVSFRNVPEPASVVLLTSAVGLVLMGRRRRLDHPLMRTTCSVSV